MKLFLIVYSILMAILPRLELSDREINLYLLVELDLPVLSNSSLALDLLAYTRPLSSVPRASKLVQVLSAELLVSDSRSSSTEE